MSMWLGIFWKLLSCFLFAVNNVLVRYLSGGNELGSTALPLPMYTLLALQNIIACCFFAWGTACFSKQRLWQQLLPRTQYGLHTVRLALSASGIACFYLSLRYFQISEVVAFSFLSPVLSFVGAICFLQERCTLPKLALFGLAMLGAFLLARPEQHWHLTEWQWYAMFPIIATLFFSLDKLIVRRLLNDNTDAHTACNASMLTFTLLITMGVCNTLLCLLLPWQTPTFTQFSAILLLAIVNIGAHFSFNQAYYYSEVSKLLPIGMSKLLFSSLLGYLCFAELPHTTSAIAGIALLTLCSIITPKII
jgi:drug/metabolite transporter (DMT)-like permease